MKRVFYLFLIILFSCGGRTEIIVDDFHPTVFILYPKDGDTFKIGEVIQYKADATDEEDGYLPGDTFTWSVQKESNIFSKMCIGKKAGKITMAEEGYYTIRVSVGDSDGNISSQAIDIILEN